MTNDTTTLSGSLDEMKDQLISELGDKGVTATFDSSTGLLGLVSKIGDIQTGGSGGANNIVMGTFTTGSTGGSTGTVTLDYNGDGYPIACLVYVNGGVYNPNNTDWYNSMNRYDAGFYCMTKSVMTSTPTYATSTSLTQNQGVVMLLYKNSTSSATSYSRSGSQSAVTYNSSSTNAASTYNCVRFKGSGTNLSYYVGNRASNSIGLARSTTFAYIVIYSE